MGLTIFWDNSNIWLVGQGVCHQREPGDELAFRIHFANLLDFVLNSRKSDYAFVCGSVPHPANHSGSGSRVWALWCKSKSAGKEQDGKLLSTK
jgi:hypothetical protein